MSTMVGEKFERQQFWAKKQDKLFDHFYSFGAHTFPICQKCQYNHGAWDITMGIEQ